MKALKIIENRKGAVGWILLWLVGLPLPLLILLFLIRGGT